MARPKRFSRGPRVIDDDDDETAKKNLIGSLLIGAVLLVAGVALYFYYTAARDIYDRVTGCPPNGGNSLTVVVIDGSDSIAPRQQAFLRNQLEAVRQDIPRDGALEVFRLGTDTEQLLEPIVSVCNPGRGKDASQWTESRKRREKLWRDTFDARLKGVFDSLLNPGTETFSPIFESIQSIGITRFSTPQWRDRPKRLVLVSDMLQFTKEFNHYLGPGDFEEFRQTSYFRKIRTDLSGVEVTLFYIPRETRKNIQGRAHRDFWKAYFLDQGARPVFVHVEG